MAMTVTNERVLLPKPGEGDGKLYVRCINVGQGDCTLIMTPKGKTMLIDCGSSAWGTSNIKSLQKDLMEIRTAGYLDVLVLTHPDGDHYNKLQQALGTFQIERIYFSNELSAYRAYSFRKWYCYKATVTDKLYGITVDAQNLTPKTLLDDGVSTLLAIAANVRAGTPGGAYDINTRSIVVHGEFGSHRFIVAADATCATEKFILGSKGSPILQSGFVRVGHHGSVTSSSSAWVKKTNPDMAYISSAQSKVYSLPRKSVVQRWLAQLAEGDDHTLGYWDDKDAKECSIAVEDAMPADAISPEEVLQWDTTSSKKKMSESCLQGTLTVTFE